MPLHSTEGELLGSSPGVVREAFVTLNTSKATRFILQTRHLTGMASSRREFTRLITRRNATLSEAMSTCTAYMLSSYRHLKGLERQCISAQHPSSCHQSVTKLPICGMSGRHNGPISPLQAPNVTSRDRT